MFLCKALVDGSSPTFGIIDRFRGSFMFTFFCAQEQKKLFERNVLLSCEKLYLIMGHGCILFLESDMVYIEKRWYFIFLN